MAIYVDDCMLGMLEIECVLQKCDCPRKEPLTKVLDIANPDLNRNVIVP